MNILFNRPSTPEAAALRERIFNVLPAASYQMEKLFGLFDIEFSNVTETACVECRTTPRLLLNKAFLEEYCQDDGDLFLLILHELYHVILGHTRLFPRVAPIDNIVFDAVINSMLCRTVGRTVGTKLFTRINSYDSLPERLLRPPPGWPDDFGSALAALPPDEQRIIGLLYGDAEPGNITYRDIYELLCKEFAECDLGRAFLLGSHGWEQIEDGLLREAVRRIVEGWPPPPFRISGRDEGRTAENFWLRPAEKPGRAFQKAFESVLRKCGIHGGRGPAVYRQQVTSTLRDVETVLPNARDRRIPALRSFLGHAPLFYRSECPERRPRTVRVPIVHLYLDVSGSMTGCLPYLSAACREPFKRGELKIFAFSTVVSELKGHDLTKAPMRNTFGTDINAVLGHVTSIAARRRPKVILIATDGYVGRGRSDLIARLGRTRAVAALTPSGHAADLQPWVHEIIQLPNPLISHSGGPSC
jgi:VWA domain containing CoxE-like protein